MISARLALGWKGNAVQVENRLALGMPSSIARTGLEEPLFIASVDLACGMMLGAVDPTSLSVAQINGLRESKFVSYLGPVFEHSSWIARETFFRRPFANRTELLRELVTTLFEADNNQKMDLIRAHPDLAGRLTLHGPLTSESSNEQASASLDRLTRAEQDRFQDYNERYRNKFGFPFIICARLSDKACMLIEFERRLQLSPKQEFETALSEIEKIAALRLEKIVNDSP